MIKLICNYCRKQYDDEDSTADDRLAYCSPRCQRLMGRGLK